MKTRWTVDELRNGRIVSRRKYICEAPSYLVECSPEVKARCGFYQCKAARQEACQVTSEPAKKNPL